MAAARLQARRTKCKVRFSLIKKDKAFQKSYMKVWVKKLLRAGMVPARTLGMHAEGMAPMERFLKMRRQMAAAAGKKRVQSRCPFSWSLLVLRWRKICLSGH